METLLTVLVAQYRPDAAALRRTLASLHSLRAVL